MGPTLLLIAIGGGLGAVCRYLSGIAASNILGDGFPYGTLVVNAAGCLAAGIVWSALVQSGTSQPKAVSLVMTGFLGGYTTFSAFSVDIWQLFNSGRVMASLFYAAGSVVLSMAALLAGIIIARELSG